MRSLRHTLTLMAGAAAAVLAATAANALPILGSAPPQAAGGGAPTFTNGSASLTVGVNAPRTIIDWQSFDIGSGENVNFNFGQKSWIALNRVAGSGITVNGALNALVGSQTGGNVWLYSAQGVAFGPNANVNVGGLLATSAAPNVADFLSPTNLDVHFTGSGGGGPVTIAGGARLNGTGYLAFVAPQVSSGSGASVVAGDTGTVAYGAVDSYEIQFIPSQQDLTFFTFIVPSASAGTAVGVNALNLAGAT
ncbi:MAG: filamentous hemagglutinin N-terminal domain-containing protein, partial [Proteobacteria bacterium]|nr:filamentous hemagglutinin N-terminal domain-containing protein [Pseudomonadota bacterium]